MGYYDELRLAHYSVKEYLISDRLKNASMHRYYITPLSANVSIAKDCLRYLLHFESPTILTASLDHEFPLIRYAAEFWPRHYRRITDDANRESVDFLGYCLVESEYFCFINWLRIFNPDGSFSKSDLKLRVTEISTPLYYMSYLGVSGIVRLLLKEVSDVNAECGFCGHALSAASFNAHEDVVELLLDKGANVNAKGGYFGHALLAASIKSHENVVRLLLEKGADVNCGGTNYGPALSAASSTGHEGVVRLLLENGANVNAEGGSQRHALLVASSNGHEDVVRLLLERGANINVEDGTHGNALSWAATNGHEEVVRLLLEEGADVNLRSGRALRDASKYGRKAVMR